MTIFVIATASVGIILALVLGAFMLLEYSRKQTEMAVIRFWMNHEEKCKLWLSQEAIKEMKREYNNQQNAL
jgi:hypothetical protein